MLVPDTAFLLYTVAEAEYRTKQSPGAQADQCAAVAVFGKASKEAANVQSPFHEHWVSFFWSPLSWLA